MRISLLGPVEVQAFTPGGRIILISDSQEKTEKAVGKAIQEMAKQNRKLRAKEANKKG